ncbi:MAG: hypothetical protein KJ905_01860 [Nanoarchaeota archaeon]|nr:hypothetical protein [Nanoarchaeota archaeon]MBU1501499.1 hypothetical protein [Nanoarchaeota archaeon]
MREEEYMRKLVDYVGRNVKKGYTIESLRWALVGQGYSRTSVEKAIEEFNKELARQAPVLKEKPVIKYEILDENNNPIEIAMSWWKKFFRF